MAETNKIDFNEPAPLTDDEDDATLAAIDRGIKDADEGRTVPLEEVRKMIPEWISKFESRKRDSGFRGNPRLLVGEFPRYGGTLRLQLG